MKKLILTLLTCAAFVGTALADVVYVTSTVSNCTSAVDCPGEINTDVNINSALIYDETYGPAGGLTSAIALAPGKPPTRGCRYFSNSFSNTAAQYWLDGFPPLGVTIAPTLGVTGGVYRIYHVMSSTAGNVSSNIVVAVTNTAGCTLSFTNTTKFQSAYGTVSGGLNTWQFLGFLTNNLDTSTPSITFYYQDGMVSAGLSQRLLLDTFMFTSEACAPVANVGISGWYIDSSTAVTVTGVDASATAVTVYQYNAGTWTMVGEITSGINAGNNTVTVSGLVRGGQLWATQTIGGLEGCIWGIPTGITVGALNPRVRLALSLRETSTQGPVGAAGSTALGNIHFLGVTNRLTAAPGFPGRVLYPSNTVWQTVTFQRGPDYANPIDQSIKWNSSVGDAVGTLNCIYSNWCVLDALAFAIDDLTQTGPFDIYIDVLQNGTTVWQNFESYPAGQTDVGFRAPGFSGTTSGNVAGAPNSAVVTNTAAYDGTKAMRLLWAWNGTVNSKWVRLTTSGVGNPVVNMDDPIVVRYLFVPNGGTMPALPPAPTLSASLVGSQTVLSWTGGHRLQTAVGVSDAYTNVTQTLSPNTYLAPWTNAFTEPARFFRLKD